MTGRLKGARNKRNLGKQDDQANFFNAVTFVLVGWRSN
jgi:hypothetical protein